MNRVRFLGFLVGALTFVALGVPASALAGTYTWNLASDFTASQGATNPDTDQYGARPWSYQEGPAPAGTPDPAMFALLPRFSTAGGLATWSDPSTGAVVGINPTSNPLTDASGNATVPPAQAFLEPGSGGQTVAVGWTSPFSSTQTISVDGSLTSDANGMPPPACIGPANWTVDQGGVPLALGTVGTSNSFSVPATLGPGASIFVTVSTPPGDCAPTGLSLQIAANGTAPGVTLTNPASGSSSTVDVPTFSGAAGSDFGADSQVTLSVYSGGTVSGNPVQTLTVPRSGAAWAATLGSALPLGTYTAQAVQANIASPPDIGRSAPVTFTVRAPAVGLDSLGSKPLATSTPTFTGTADNDTGSDPFVVVQVFPGTSATGVAALTLTTAPGASGRFSVQAGELADGTYTARAVQGSAAGNTGFSAPLTFSVDANAPVVTLVRPAKRSRSDVLQLVFAGTAGGQSFDARVVTIAVYRGRKAVGKPLATLKGSVSASTWSVNWPPATILRRGLYTARASQTDALGHVGSSLARTFRIVPLPPVIGGPATIDKSGRVRLKISCNEPAGDTCAGNVLVLTEGNFQTVAGGALGPLTVMFAYIHIPGGQTATVTRMALATVATVLRRHARVPVAISATLHPRRGKTIHATARIDLRRIGR